MRLPLGLSNVLEKTVQMLTHPMLVPVTHPSREGFDPEKEGEHEEHEGKSNGEFRPVHFTSGSFKPGRSYPVLKGLEIGWWSIFGVSADSQRFLFALPTKSSEQSQINVVKGWFEELKRLAPTN